MLRILYVEDDAEQADVFEQYLSELPAYNAESIRCIDTAASEQVLLGPHQSVDLLISDNRLLTHDRYGTGNDFPSCLVSVANNQHA